MPLWQIYHPAGLYEDQESKSSFAKDITKIYTKIGLPPFYVVVNFIPLPKEDILVGGEPSNGTPFIRIVITNIAVKMPETNETYTRFTSSVDAVLKPHIADKGYDWEYHVAETERRLWKINGLIPPPWKSEEEARWAEQNRPVPYEGAFAPL
ncbi:hypothetical protein MYU51_011971 [Penicillium brevicompactum]|uniref:Tautomerase cis-CaaD-like domain-containing protein n=2 Tax=Penicillium brevicompactum TaxID=5074 RepID=A0A9W9Q9X8_PENBR|nr:uncharacterized protein N7506_002377 [Penicillium brevicompactum]KAJ5329819.1 hypothetical protein N7452_010209 [Penicillium brevicompactum]KAJ5349124.1 hypothetical protein N7506_002377 [Penicillium brevicompactum]